MAVLFITHKHPPSVGGMENQSLELIKGYQKLDTVYSIIYEGKEKITTFFLKLKFRVNKLLKQHPEIETIHLNDGLLAAFFHILKINPQGRKVAITFHGLDVVFPLPIYQKYIIPKLFQYDAFICVSRATKEECQLRNFPAEKLFVVNNGVDVMTPKLETNDEIHLQLFKKLGIDFSKDKILLSIGRPVIRKGFSWFAREVMPLLDENYKFIHIGHVNISQSKLDQLLSNRVVKYLDLFLGRPNDVRSLVDASKIDEKRIILTGRISDELRDFLIRKANLILMPNIKDPGDMEGFGLVALEASVQGKTVLASNIEGIVDAVHDEKNGFLAESGNKFDWKEKILKFSQQYNTYNEAIRSYSIDNYSWEKMVCGYKTIFDSFPKLNQN